MLKVPDITNISSNTELAGTKTPLSAYARAGSVLCHVRYRPEGDPATADSNRTVLPGMCSRGPSESCTCGVNITHFSTYGVVAGYCPYLPTLPSYALRCTDWC
eukprot:628398-Rhodomonas_salina.1